MGEASDILALHAAKVEVIAPALLPLLTTVTLW